MILSRYIELDGAFGCEYIFGKAGEALPEHAHTPDLCHASQAIRGSARLDSCGSRVTFTQGTEVMFDAEKPHRIEALEDGTILFNRLLIRPADWREWLSEPQRVVYGL